MQSEARGFIYFVRCPINQLIKIGFTQEHPDRRLGMIRTMSPVPLEALGIIPGDRMVERRMHSRFHPYRRHGEWFESGDRLLYFIRRWVRPWPAPLPPLPYRHEDIHEANEEVMRFTRAVKASGLSVTEYTRRRDLDAHGRPLMIGVVKTPVI